MSKIRHTPKATTAIRPLTAGQGIDAHQHDEHQIIYAGRGVLAVTTDAGTWIAPGNRALWVPAGTAHSPRAHGDLDLHTIGLPRSVNPLDLRAPTALTVGPLLRELIVAYTRGATNSAEAAAAPEREPERLRLRAVLLDQLRASPQQPMHLPTPTDPRLAAVCALLHRAPADDRTLAAFGAEVGASERTLSRLFRAELGMTFPQWRTQLRLYHAVVLLSEGVPVTTVACRCGWSSTSAFIDVFRRAFGHTPGAHLRH
ncbi:AraC family transcriptional regulator [Streptomyces sp. WZ-12]|uniref:AraC family transcriptional regulator n=1 Tax=Streptomyces sp. WZ-12 TaxID=3030210 RepID=UPI002381551F|nr:helix-turn-helix transcriptional regulator [Streptomyces sp. WZ-12]